MHNLILPNPARVDLLRDQIRQKLHASMQHLIFDVFSPNIFAPITHSELRKIVLGGSRFPNAAVFALHGAMLNAALQNDMTHLPKTFRILGEIVNRNTEEPDLLRVDPMCDEHIHKDDVWLLQRAFADDVGLTTSLAVPPADVVSATAELVSKAVNFLDEAAPDWGQELRLLASQVYLASSDVGDLQLFVGAAVFDAFGAILLNPHCLRDLPSVMMALIHETSHQQMFLYHLDDPILTNDAGEMFASPLRVEPRPMEGVFHAMWVSARMALAADAILDSSSRLLCSDELDRYKANAVRAFRDCEHTVAAHAKLTDFGQSLFKDARNAVDAI